MIERPITRRVLLAASLAAASVVYGASTAYAAHDVFPLSDAELARLGVTVGKAQPVDLVEVAAAPAKVVVPPAHQALVSAPLGGVVARLLAAEGEDVRSGQPLAEIESADYANRQREYLDAFAANELAAAQEARDRALFDEGIIAERRLNEAGAEARAARAKLDQSRAALKLAGLGDAELARLAERRELATRLVLHAPFAGVVAAQHTGVGARVDALDPVVAIADLRELWLELRLAQEEATRVEPGMTVAVDTSGKTIRGPVTTVGRVVDPQTQMVLVRASVDNAGGTLRAGQFLAARVLARPEHGVAYTVPAAAIMRTGPDAFVFVRDGQQFSVRRVDVVGEDGTQIYIGAGIEAGTEIAIEGVSALKARWRSLNEEGG